MRDSSVLCGAVESGMAHIPGHDRSQLLLLPEAVDDYVAADNPVRFIEALVDGLDLATLGFIGTVPKATGRPGYAPADLLKLYIYGYLNRTRSSRRPELGSLVIEYLPTGTPLRTFGELRPTGQEKDPQVHAALNVGITLLNPKGGYYFVFLSGVPMFRKYDPAGTLVFERHIEGVELDPYVAKLPTTWPRKRGDIPIVPATVRTAAVDPDGNLWISLAAPYTYVYDASGDKRHTLQFRGAGIISPTSFFFTRDRRVLVTPGCYAFDAGG